MFPHCDYEATAETDALDFKAKFDPSSRQEWCELIKDVIAMASSGGGMLIFGVNDDGSPSGADLHALTQLDPADVTNKIHSYTEQHFAEFEIASGVRQGQPIVVFRVAGARTPIIFTAPGTYPTGNTQKSAFGKGTLYFRHGPKSEPGTTADLRFALERELERVKSFWLDGISRVVAAPPGATVQVVQQDVRLDDSADATAIRLTSAEGAPLFRAVQADKLYPHRQKELLKALGMRLGTGIVGSHDLLCVRRVHATDTDPTFSHKSQWSPRQYSDAFLDWLVEKFEADRVHKAREAYRQHADEG